MTNTQEPKNAQYVQLGIVFFVLLLVDLAIVTVAEFAVSGPTWEYAYSYRVELFLAVETIAFLAVIGLFYTLPGFRHHQTNKKLKEGKVPLLPDTRVNIFLWMFAAVTIPRLLSGELFMMAGLPVNRLEFGFPIYVLTALFALHVLDWICASK